MMVSLYWETSILADLRNVTSRFSRRLTTFISDSKLSVIGLDDPVMANSNNTWHSSDFQCQSWIDYILVSESFMRD